MDPRLKLGTRGSPLALVQAHQAAAVIADANGWDVADIAIVPVTTTGDRVQDRPLADIGGKALWTKELDQALGAGTVDACVHSMKDVEGERPDKFRIAAILPRIDVRDRLIGAETIDTLPPQAVVGTCSPRRAAQLLRLRPDLRIEPLRGNVQTRLAKVESGALAATLLAAAGLDRLGIAAGHGIPVDQMVPAPGQAAIGIECRSDDAQTIAAIGAASDPDSFACVMAERAFTAALGATCHSPVGALAVMEEGRILLQARLFNLEGSDCVADEAMVAPGNIRVPAELARSMLGRAGRSIRFLFDDQ